MRSPPYAALIPTVSCRQSRAESSIERPVTPFCRCGRSCRARNRPETPRRGPDIAAEIAEEEGYRRAERQLRRRRVDDLHRTKPERRRTAPRRPSVGVIEEVRRIGPASAERVTPVSTRLVLTPLFLVAPGRASRHGLVACPADGKRPRAGESTTGQEDAARRRADRRRRSSERSWAGTCRRTPNRQRLRTSSRLRLETRPVLPGRCRAPMWRAQGDKRRPAGQHLKQRHAKRPDVCTPVSAFSAHLFPEPCRRWSRLVVPGCVIRVAVGPSAANICARPKSRIRTWPSGPTMMLDGFRSR